MLGNGSVIYTSAVIQRAGTGFRSCRIRVIANIGQEFKALGRRLLVAGVDVTAYQSAVCGGLGQVPPYGVGDGSGLVHPELTVERQYTGIAAVPAQFEAARLLCLDWHQHARGKREQAAEVVRPDRCRIFRGGIRETRRIDTQCPAIGQMQAVERIAAAFVINAAYDKPAAAADVVLSGSRPCGPGKNRNLALGAFTLRPTYDFHPYAGIAAALQCSQ